MSLAHDRAQAISDAIQRDGVHQVFLMPGDRFTRRIVAVPQGYDEVLEFLSKEGLKPLGEFGPGTSVSAIETRICRATGQPMFHKEHGHVQVIDSSRTK